jgi:nucleotide-binding universal stress UspA family protein
VIQALNHLHLQSTTQVILCHVIPPIDLEADVAADRPRNPSEELVYRQVEQQFQIYQEHFPGSSQIEIVRGDPAEEIVRLAHLQKADLIVIGNRGLTGLKRVLQGSVSSAVVADAPCSVLVIKA